MKTIGYKLRSLEAQLVTPFEPGDKILQEIPGTRKHAKQTGELVREKKSNQQALRNLHNARRGATFKKRKVTVDKNYHLYHNETMKKTVYLDNDAAGVPVEILPIVIFKWG